MKANNWITDVNDEKQYIQNTEIKRYDPDKIRYHTFAYLLIVLDQHQYNITCERNERIVNHRLA